MLVVEDEPTFSSAMVRALTQAGYEALTAMSAEAANDIVRHEHVDAMLLDLVLKPDRGDVVFQYASALQPHLKYRTLFVTGDISDRAREMIEQCDCPYLYKPFDIEVMLDVIGRFFARAHDQAG